MKEIGVGVPPNRIIITLSIGKREINTINIINPCLSTIPSNDYAFPTQRISAHVGIDFFLITDNCVTLYFYSIYHDNPLRQFHIFWYLQREATNELWSDFSCELKILYIHHPVGQHSSAMDMLFDCVQYEIPLIRPRRLQIIQFIDHGIHVVRISVNSLTQNMK